MSHETNTTSGGQNIKEKEQNNKSRKELEMEMGLLMIRLQQKQVSHNKVAAVTVVALIS